VANHNGHGQISGSVFHHEAAKTRGKPNYIFYNNAARFLRLSEEEIARHHGI